MAQDNFPALPGIYRVLFLYLEPSVPRFLILTRVQWFEYYSNSVHDRASDHGLARSRRILVSPPAYSIRPTRSDYFTGASNVNGRVATYKLSVHRGRNHHGV